MERKKGKRLMFLSCFMFQILSSRVPRAECGNGSLVRKRYFRSQKGSVKGRTTIIVVLILRMNVEEGVNIHAPCFEMRTRVIEEIF